MKEKINNKFDEFLLGILFRIAKRWGCDIQLPSDYNQYEDKPVRWIKLIFPKNKK